MDQDIDWVKVAKYLAGECSIEERLEVEHWMGLSPDHAKSVHRMKQLWKLSGQKTIEWDNDVAWREVSRKAGINTATTPRLTISPLVTTSVKRGFQVVPRILLRAAAVGIVLIGIPYLVYHLSHTQSADNQKVPVRELTAARGQLAEFRFGDGTNVTLNVATHLRFPELFDEKVREVYLEGEAFFKVAPLNGVPFVVRTHGATVEVLGTEFSVQAWPGEKQVQVVVAEGKVVLRSGEGETQKSIVLSRGQMSALLESGELSLPVSVDIGKHLAWVSGKLLFENTPFDEVLKSLERKYNLTCYTADPAMLLRRLTATFKDEPVNEVLRIISLSLDLRYKRVGDSVIFINRKQVRSHTS